MVLGSHGGNPHNIDVSLDLYKIFCTVVDTGNMSAAARELYISQPAVSMAIRQLEDRLGKPLLIRSSKGIKTTPEGGVLYEYLRQALLLVETAEKKYFEMVNMEMGEIKIGASDTLLGHYLMPYIEKFISLYPNINIKVTNRTTYETLKLLVSGQVDLGFVNLPIDTSNSLEIYNCIEVQDCLIGGVKYAHLAENGISLRELKEYPLLMLEKESNTRLYLDKYAESNGALLSPNIEFGSSEFLVSFARINLGLAFVIREFTIKEIDNESIFEIPVLPPIPTRSIGLVKLKDVALSYAAERFANILQAEA